MKKNITHKKKGIFISKKTFFVGSKKRMVIFCKWILMFIFANLFTIIKFTFYEPL